MNNNATHTILIAGGAGFIGSHLSEFCLDKNFKVMVIDSLITGREENIKKLHKNKNFSFIKADISKSDFPKHLTNNNFSHIFHLASPASPPKYQAKPIETMHANSVGTENLLKIAKKQNSRFVFASTSEVYGDPQVHPQTESYWGNVNSFGPRSCYDEAKRYGEAICYTYLNKFDLDIRIARIFNTYGPNMDPADGRVVSNFINQIIKNKPISIYGDGSQTRSFCYVSDMVEGLWKLAIENVKGEIINIGNPVERTVLETAKLIKKITNSESEIVYSELPQ
ncbi:MAG: NAD-dependent epimerase/dehydratase family protein, partial [Patescibacteria group bacterium]